MLSVVRAVIEAVVGRVRTVRARHLRELGASAIEWAIIAAVSVVIASLIGAIVYNVVQGKGEKLKTCASKAVNTSCAP